LKPLSNQQRLNQVNTEQLFENFRSASVHAATYRYGMRWKTVRGTQYLFRDKDRRGNGKSLGPKAPETEAVLAAFVAGRAAAQERLKRITEKVQEQARLNKALPGLQWLLNSPKLDAVAIDEDGWPVPMRVPDPRAFALHKAWLADDEQEQFKKAAKSILALSDEQIRQLIENGQFEEVKKDGQKISQ